jgi:hypothetical protein
METVRHPDATQARQTYASVTVFDSDGSHRRSCMYEPEDAHGAPQGHKHSTRLQRTARGTKGEGSVHTCCPNGVYQDHALEGVSTRSCDDVLRARAMQIPGVHTLREPVRPAHVISCTAG